MTHKLKLKNGSEYLTTGTVFIHLMRFLLHNLISSNFLVLLWYLFKKVFFFHLHLFDVVRFKYYPSICKFLFSASVLIVPWFGSFILSIMCRFPLLIIYMAPFLCQIPSLCPDSIFSLLTWVFPIFSNFWQTVWCRLCTWSVWSFLSI